MRDGHVVRKRIILKIELVKSIVDLVSLVALGLDILDRQCQ